MDDIRSFLIDSVSRTGGHLASNLGVVELTQAIHSVYDVYRDRVIFDVGHQSYVHKYLTGRAEQFATLRQFGGLAGFPKPSESDADAFIAGHASNSVSVALGMARARTLSGGNYEVACLIGDGALTGGLAYEGLANAGQSGERMVVIFNDNGMSIAPTLGSVASLVKRTTERPGYYAFKRFYRKKLERFRLGRSLYKLTHIVKSRLKRLLLPSGANIFEDLGFRYFGPVDGHNPDKLTFILNEAKSFGGMAFVHVLTNKGKGYAFAEANPDLYHSVPPFDPAEPLHSQDCDSYSSVFGAELCELAAADSTICAITAAMPDGTGLLDFAERFPDRFFDEGIAEAHALTMAAGLAKQGMRPVAAIYSTFLQRTYDSIIHDISILSLPVVIGVDRSGLVGGDGETHQGIFDLAMLMAAPNMLIYCPASFAELRECLRSALSQSSNPVAIRYSRGSTQFLGDSLQTSANAAVTVVSYGTIAANAYAAIQLSGVECDFIKPAQIRPLDLTPIVESVRKTGKLTVLEEVTSNGSLGQHILAELAQLGVMPRRVLLRNCGSGHVQHGSAEELQRLLRLDAESFAEDLRTL